MVGKPEPIEAAFHAPCSASLPVGEIYVPDEVKTFNRVMVDIETMSLNKHKALILSIGMVEFDPTGEELELGARKLIVPELTQQILIGRHVSLGTQEFWAKQPKEASAHWMRDQDRTLLRSAMCQVRDFCRGKSEVWANGTQFDLTNLEQLAIDCGENEDLWHYRAPRDMRTVVQTLAQRRHAELPAEIAEGLVLHEPVSDCIWQALKVWEHWPANYRDE